MDDQKPRYLIAAEKRAKELGIPIEDILDTTALEQSAYPTDDCLDPWEIDLIRVGQKSQLSPASAEHLKTCDACAALVAVAKNPDWK
jgi:hypothetical protein